MDYKCKIERAQNGYEVEMTDPKIVESNHSDSKAGMGRYRDPQVSYVFKTLPEVLKFLKANLDKALPAGEFESSFDKATKESMDE